MSVAGTTPGPRAGAAASDDEAGVDEAERGETEAKGPGQRGSAPRGLGAEAAEADAEGMDVAEALEASAESAAGEDLRPRPEGWETWPRSRKKKWAAFQKSKQRK